MPLSNQNTTNQEANAITTISQNYRKKGTFFFKKDELIYSYFVVLQSEKKKIPLRKYAGVRNLRLIALL